MSSRASLNHVFRTVWNQALGAMVAVAEISTSHGGSGSASRASLGGSRRNPLAFTNLSALALGVALAWSAHIGDAQANPTGGVAVVGQASMVSSGNRLTVITQNGAGVSHSAINWQSFSIPAGNTTHFQQPNAVSTVINRVVTNTPSAIFGTLSSNGNVVLVNQSGIAVGAGAIVDTAGFTASSLRMGDADAMAGRMRFGDGNASTSGVSVQGSILARSGDVVLLGSGLDTGKDALIQAPNGNTILAAGQQIELTGRGLEGIRLQVQAPTDSAVNLGTLKGDAVAMFAGTLKHSGLIHASTASLEGGRVVLKASGDAFVEGAGKIIATGTVGGHVDVLGNRVAVTDQSVIDASGELGGGNVRVGGDYQGKNPAVQNASFTYFGPQSSIKADATTHGDGGKVIVWADDTARAYGGISAQGGASGGNGGFVETSGKQSLDVLGIRVDTRAARGAMGSWLLDPFGVDINAIGPTTTMGTAPNFTASGVGSVLQVSTLTGAMLSSNVTVTASGSLTVSDPISSFSGNSLKLEAQGGPVAINAAISLAGTSGTGNLEIVSGVSYGMTLGAGISLSTSGGSNELTLKSGDYITQSAGTIAAVKLKVDAGGAVSLPNANNVSTIAANVGGLGSPFQYNSGTGIAVGTVGGLFGVTTNGGAISLNSPATIQIDEKLDATAVGNIQLISGSSINQTANGVVWANKLTANSGGTGGIQLAVTPNHIAELSITAGGTSPVFYWDADAFAVGPTTVGGSLSLKSSGGGITQSGGSIATGASGSLSIEAGSGNVNLGGAGNNLNNLTVISGGAVDVQNGPAIGLNAISAGSFKLKAGGSIAMSGSGTINTSAGGIYIESMGGSISSAEGITAVGGPVKLKATSGLTLSSSIIGTNSDAPGDAVVLINLGGILSASTPITTSGSGGRWLTYTPTFGPSNVFPSGWAFKQVNAPYGTAVQGSGNGVLVSAAPLLTTTPLVGSVSKVYDGGLGIGVTGLGLAAITGGVLDFDIVSGAVGSGGAGTLSDRNVGTGKYVTFGGITISGVTTSVALGSKPVYGYELPSLSGNIATVTQRPSSTWTGAAGNLWGSAGNWDALPDGENVGEVVIPAGFGPIIFDSSIAPTILKSLNTGSPMLVTGGSIQVSASLNAAGFGQTGGTVSGAGTFKVNGPFKQTGGSIAMSAIDIVTPIGEIVFYDLKAPVVSLVASSGAISQLGGVQTAALTTRSTAGTVLNGPANNIGSFTASNTGSGAIELTNVGALSILGINNTGGSIVVSNTGAVFASNVVGQNGKISITANSPLTIGVGGVSSQGDIELNATNLTSSGDMVLNGPVNSGAGAVKLSAANNLTQNGSVFGALGVTATVGGTLTVAPSATSGTTPVNYSVSGRPVTAPPGTVGTPPIPIPTPIPIPIPIPTNTPTIQTLPVTVDAVREAVVQTNLVTTFLDKFEVALQTQSDEKRDKDKLKNDLVVEGEICRP